MSSTRHAKDSSVFHQSRYASSPEFERGLIANLVARRCSVLSNAEDRELIWFVQYLSHRDGGLSVVASYLLARFDKQIGTPSMLETGRADSQHYTAEEMRKIRLELPGDLRRRFPLRGETKREILQLSASCQMSRLRISAENSRRLQALVDNNRLPGSAAIDEGEMVDAQNHPKSYPVSSVRHLCRQAAAAVQEGSKSQALEIELKEMCLDPEWGFSAGGPWYFAGLIDALREYRQQWKIENSQGHVTALGKKVCEELDFTLQARGRTVIEGGARLGKSFSAKAWCAQHAGQARFVEVPTGNDDASFYRAIARGLGLGNFLNYKVAEIRQRVEAVILTGDILLVLDEAHRLWPQRNLRYGYPNRIEWLMSMGNGGVPICMIVTPQFFESQKAIEKTGWNSAQLTGRIDNYVKLPSELSADDLISVGRVVLPHASDEVLKALAIYARASARYLAAVDSIAKRAQYIARRQGRDQCTAVDVREAMKESVIPSDAILLRTLNDAKKAQGRQRIIQAPVPAEEMSDSAAARDVRPASPAGGSFCDRGQVAADLITA